MGEPSLFPTGDEPSPTPKAAPAAPPAPAPKAPTDKGAKSSGAKAAAPAKPKADKARGKPKGRAKGKGKGKSQTPMMEQFWRAKKEAPGAILFFRMGDFYELFHEDAVVASRELGLALTSRSKGSDEPVAMAGVPVRSVEGYLIKLVRKGHTVAICEQLQDPREVKGIVDRGVVRVVTPGTLTEEDALDARRPNFLASVWPSGERVAIVWADLSTGRLMASVVAPDALRDELGRIAPAEVLLPTGRELGLGESDLRDEIGAKPTEREEWRFERETTYRLLLRHFKVKSLEGFGLEDDSPIIPAAGALVEYVEETQHAACEHLRRIQLVDAREHLVLDRATRSCLELVATQRDGRREGTLLDTIDATLTAMGSRLLREWLLNPLRHVGPILDRQQGVAELVDGPFLREELRELLDRVLDVERLVGKVSTGRANARDLVALRASLELVPPIKEKLSGAYSALLGRLHEALDPLDDLTARIATTLVDDPPMTIREGGVVRDGFSEELDELRTIAGDAKSWMARFQAEESERSGLPGLKIGFNSVFGYYLEVPRGQIDRVPEHYIRKQTIKSAERYITPELKEFETKVLKSEELSRDLEYRVFNELREAVGAEVGRILDTAHALAEVDAIAGMAQIAAAGRYVRPTIDDGDSIEIVEGRHPVIERSASCEAFVPNDTRLDLDGRRITILTGPNMAGKSTYIRQVALIALLAQIGSFVPADEARIGVVDRIFTRVGAGDDISRGESTFMVEMVEIANILNNASERSLVILDEVGRGTSTFDGLALAWAIVEHLHEAVGARALFATHYHQLTDLSARYPAICNQNVAVREWGEEIVFLHKIVEGGTDRSYGIHVARLAGVPDAVIQRAKKILSDLELDEEDLARRILAGSGAAPAAEPLPFRGEQAQRTESDVERELRELDPDRLTPIDALLKLRELRDRL
ncbi:MAG: DNA mismatch repair protein MutS [Planctomycetota bacterium]